MKKLRDDTRDERQRLEQARRDYELQKDWTDWIVFIVLLFATMFIDILIS